MEITKRHKRSTRTVTIALTLSEEMYNELAEQAQLTGSDIQTVIRDSLMMVFKQTGGD